MHVLAEKLRPRISTGRSPKNWMADWNLDDPINIPESSRYKCFTEVETMAEELLSNELSAIENARMPSRLTGSRSPPAAADWHGRLFSLLCRPYFEEVAIVLKTHNTNYLVVAFDECTQLNVKELPSGPKSWEPLWHMSLVALQRIIKAYDPFKPPNVNLWFLLLDTNSSIPELASSGKNVPSRRFTKGFRTLPPWPYIGFNQMVREGVMERIKLPSDVLTIQHLKEYGRPVGTMPLHSHISLTFSL
jgi:hypothetical protein